MAEVADRTVSAERAALGETRRRIGETLDAIDQRVRIPAVRVSRGIADLRQARGGELITAAASTARRVRAVIDTVRTLSRGQQAVVASGAVAAMGVLAWASRAREPQR